MVQVSPGSHFEMSWLQRSALELKARTASSLCMDTQMSDRKRDVTVLTTRVGKARRPESVTFQLHPGTDWHNRSILGKASRWR